VFATVGKNQYEVTVLSSAADSDERREDRKHVVASELVRAAVAAVEPASAIARHVCREGHILHLPSRSYDLRRYRRVLVVGGGKAGAPMAQAIESILGEYLSTGVVNVKYGYTAPTKKIEIRQAGHPIPDEKGVAGTQKMVELLSSATADDLVIALISGGGSALMILPVEGVSLADKRRLTDALLRSGATINEINTVRKHLSRVKGGGLARTAYPAEVISLILSDVVGNPLDVIASGPTVPDTTTFLDAKRVLEAHYLWERVPASIRQHLQSGVEGQIPDTPKPGDPVFERTHNVVVASNEIACRAVMQRASELGLRTLLLSTYVEGEAREVARVLAAVAKEIVHSGNPIGRPACVVAGGETTVTVKGQGLGGRNQEIALAAGIQIDGLSEAAIAAFSTDGSDGPTNAAGAIADGTTAARARQLGLDPGQFLTNNDSHRFFAQLGDLIVTGPTNTNVNDVALILVL